MALITIDGKEVPEIAVPNGTHSTQVHISWRDFYIILDAAADSPVTAIYFRQRGNETESGYGLFGKAAIKALLEKLS